MRVVSMINVRMKGLSMIRRMVFYIDTASDILIDDCTVTWGDIRPDQAAEGIGQRDVRNLKIKK